MVGTSNKSDPEIPIFGSGLMISAQDNFEIHQRHAAQEDGMARFFLHRDVKMCGYHIYIICVDNHKWTFIYCIYNHKYIVYITTYMFNIDYIYIEISYI